MSWTGFHELTLPWILASPWWILPHSYRLLMYQTWTGTYMNRNFSLCLSVLCANHRVILLVLLQLKDWHASPFLQRLMPTRKVINQALVAKQKLITQFPLWSPEFWHWKEKKSFSCLDFSQKHWSVKLGFFKWNEFNFCAFPCLSIKKTKLNQTKNQCVEVPIIL